ncbi:MAG: hypothetical protein FJW23_03600 [Acidimicrobiia bacterium]|nr:hypothetical protein [Acidimicrobiia bacterium]
MTNTARAASATTRRLGRFGTGLTASAACAGLLLAWARPDAQDLTFARGQNIAPAYEGWEQNPDGSFDLVFGYFNRNWDEAIDVPVGPDNHIEPGGPDQGQPTHFQPRRNLFVFRVRVPADFGDKELVWTLTSRGITERAYGTLKPIYVINDNIITANNGAAGGRGGTLELNANTGPELEVEGTRERTARVGEPVVLHAIATDDGVPAPRGMPINRGSSSGSAAVSSAVGLRLSWFVYRGGGRVTFDPPQFKTYMDTRAGSPWAWGWTPPPVPPDGRWIVRATFHEPGQYVLRCLAHDGGLMEWEDITFNVQ